MQMVDIFENLQLISITMFVLGLAGVIAYERTRAKTRRPRPSSADKPSS